jgi:TRAP-type C4-dicarboxylate transport system substrate-binding protein
MEINGRKIELGQHQVINRGGRKMKKGMLVALALLLVAGMVSVSFVDAASAPAPAPDKTMTLRFSCHVPESPATTFAKYVMEEVTKRTNGRIAWQTYWGGSLVGGKEALKATSDGVVDMSFGLWIYEPTLLPLGGFDMLLPFNSPDVRAQARMKREIYQKNPALNGELAKVKIAPIITFIGIPSLGLVSLKPIDSIDDLKGKKIGHTAVELTPILKAAGAVSVISEAPEFYARLERGVIDGCILPLVISSVLRLGEVAKHYTELDLSTSVGYTLWINLNTWNKLLPEDQKIFQQVGLEAEERQTVVWESFEKKVRQGAGVTFHRLPAADTAKWIKALPDVVAEWAKKMESKGLPGWEIMNMYLQLHEKNGWKFPRQWGMK